MIRIIRTACLLSLAGLVLGACATAPKPPQGNGAGQSWFKGNTHTHTLWSDGDGAPELAADFYKTHGYQFLVLSDHNILSKGERWIDISDEPKSRLTTARFEELRTRFGEDWVEERVAEEKRQMRLKTLDDLRDRFEEPDRFLFIQGEEITDSFEGAPVHINGINLAEVIPPQHGESVRDTMQRNLDAVVKQAERLNRPVLAHVNHPNFHWALTPMDIASIRNENFFEVYNGHPSCLNHGDSNHPSTDVMWDIALTYRLTETDLPLLYGLATDDAHAYHHMGVTSANPGRGWVMVRAGELTADSIVTAMKRGDFYASSGVVVEDYRHDDKKYEVKIQPEEDAVYITRFIGTRAGPNGVLVVGETLHETVDNPAVYEFKGDELYVRVKVTSSQVHPNPYVPGDHHCAWLQPIKP